jgi:hypothetical protein
MLALFTLLKSKAFWFISILIICGGLIGALGWVNKDLHSQITTLTEEVGAAQVTINDKTAAAKLCSDNTISLKAQADFLAAQAASAVEAASSVAQTHFSKAKQLSQAKPDSNDDYKSTNDFVNSLLTR